MSALNDFYFHDPRVILVPAEELGPDGLSQAFAKTLQEREGWSTERTDLLSNAFVLYWQRLAHLASQTHNWAPPRSRNIALIRDPDSILPYVQMLNNSTWTAYACDFDPAVSNAEFGAYVLAYGDQLFLSGEITAAMLISGSYWLERTEAECQAFVEAAKQSPRPDADAYRATADALPWLRELMHETLKPPTMVANYQPIPDAGLLVPPTHKDKPDALTQRGYDCFQKTVTLHRQQQAATDQATIDTLYQWLAETAPPLLITGNNNRTLWDPEAPERITRLRNELKHGATAAAVASVHADLQVMAERTRQFHAALKDTASLAKPDGELSQDGFSYIHNERGMIAYNLHEAGMERLTMAGMPYGRAMLGARTVHEWCHLAVDGGCVPWQEPNEQLAALTEAMDRVIGAAPGWAQQLTQADLAEATQQTNVPGAPQVAGTSPGAGLARLLFTRMEDYQANLLGHRFMSVAEQESYVRHNVRTLRTDYQAHELWRMLTRYLYEYQYLRFSKMTDPRGFFLRSTWFDADYFGSGLLTEELFTELTDLVGQVCDLYQVDESRFAG